MTGSHLSFELFPVSYTAYLTYTHQKVGAASFRNKCDFVTGSAAVQVCAELTPFNRDREVQGVLRALALPGKRRPLILTLDQRDRLKVEGTVVDVLPAWEWMSGLVDSFGIV